MNWGLSSEKTIRPPFIAGLVAAVLLGGIVAAERAGFFTPPQPSHELVATVLPGAVIALTNQEREDYNLGTLRANDLLNRAAQLKADDMAEKSYYAHVSPDGTIPPYWLDRVGYKYQMMGENLVIDRENSEAVVSAWMGSHDHRENMLNPTFTEIGVGVAYGEYKGQNTIYVVEMLAKPIIASQRSTPVPVTVSVPKPTPVAVPVITPTVTPVRAPIAVAPKPAPKPRVVDPIAPVLKAVASTTLAEVPVLVSSTSYPVPPLANDAGTPVELSAAPVVSRNKPTLGTAIRSFAHTMVTQMRDFFRL